MKHFLTGTSIVSMLQSRHLPTNQWVSSLIVAILLFMACFVPRFNQLDAHWSSDEARWLSRSAVFMDAVQRGQFDRTLIAYHPGVTTMWLAGLRTFFLDKLTWESSKDLVYARWFLGVTLVSGLVVAFFLLIRLFQFWSASFAWAFLVTDPFFLAQSRRVHTDALAAVFILLTVLLFLLYCRTPSQRRYLIFSGIMFGLACLSKSYSLVLLLWMPVCLFLYRKNDTPWRKFLYTAFGTGVLFLNCSLLTVFVLWPIFWTPAFLLFGLCLGGITVLVYQTVQNETWQSPVLCAMVFFVVLAINVSTIQVVLLIFDKIAWALTTAHEVEHFFMGKVVYNPGWFFYPLSLSIKSMPFTIPLAIFGVILIWKERKKIRLSAQHLQIVFSLIFSILLFILCLSGTAKKLSRYLLPGFLMMDLLAGIGLFYSVKWVGSLFKIGKLRQMGQIACVGLVFAFTASPVFAVHPYYSSYYNPCWRMTDITQIITIGDASGLDIAAKYMNLKTNATQMSVQVSPLGTEFFQYYFVGDIYRTEADGIADTSELPDPDYEIVYIRDSQIGRVPQEGTRGGELEHTITLNGIEYVWIYRLKGKEK